MRLDFSISSGGNAPGTSASYNINQHVNYSWNISRNIPAHASVCCDLILFSLSPTAIIIRFAEFLKHFGKIMALHLLSLQQ